MPTGHYASLKGQRFGKWLVVRRAYKHKQVGTSAFWYCVCDCGNVRIIPAASLTTGKTKSCNPCSQVGRTFSAAAKAKMSTARKAWWDAKRLAQG